MENIVKLLLVEQMQKKSISARELHRKMETLCDRDPSYQWISLATLERRIQSPSNITSEELVLMRDAMRAIVSEATWIHIRRHITEKMRQGYASQIDEAISNGFALHQRLADYRNDKGDKAYKEEILDFYMRAPEGCRTYWQHVLGTYLSLPDIAKASVLCSAYIGRSIEKDKEHARKIERFIDCFPIFQGINIISGIDDDRTRILGNILTASTYHVDSGEVPDEFRQYAIDKRAIRPGAYPSGPRLPKHAIDFLKLSVRYKHSITDYHAASTDLIHGLCFLLYMDRSEWLLAYATSMFFFSLGQAKDRLSVRREYHDRGCTGFRFTDDELDYLCELLYVMGHK